MTYIKNKKDLVRLRKELEDLKKSCEVHEKLAKVLLKGQGDSSKQSI